VFLDDLGEGVATTQSELRQSLRCIGPEVLVELETYTWQVLPEALRRGGLLEGLARELAWLEEVRAKGPA
jgi:hypothetical protein